MEKARLERAFSLPSDLREKHSRSGVGFAFRLRANCRTTVIANGDSSASRTRRSPSWRRALAGAIRWSGPLLARSALTPWKAKAAVPALARIRTVAILWVPL